MLRKLCFIFLFATALIACDSSIQSDSKNNKAKTLLQGKTMGTTYNIGVVHSKDIDIDEDTLQVNIDELLKNINQQVSTYIPSSQISQFNKSDEIDWFKVDPYFFDTVQSAQLVSKQSDGQFDISILPIVNLWGFGAETHDEPPSQVQIQQALAEVGYQKLQLDPEQSSIKKINPKLSIDLSAIAKGFAVDKISQLLIDKGFSNHLVEIGGELRVSGTNQADKKWRIAIEQPDMTTNIAKHGLEISNRAVATSGDYRNYFVEKGVRRSHIIDPKTGYPITHNLASVTVLHNSAMMADAYATALLVMGDKQGKIFAEEQKLDVLMIVRTDDKFTFWSSSNLFQ